MDNRSADSKDFFSGFLARRLVRPGRLRGSACQGLFQQPRSVDSEIVFQRQLHNARIQIARERTESRGTERSAQPGAPRGQTRQRDPGPDTVTEIESLGSELQRLLFGNPEQLTRGRID